jgi:phenylacetate-coenzyme A ligase PaaK-like adenylate-forming protein
MPFIRYDMGDLATPSPEGYIGGFRIVEDIEGRSTDRLVFPSGRAFGGVTLGQLLFSANDFEPLIRFYQCAQTGPNTIELRLVWRRPPSPEERDTVARAMRTITDPDTDIRIRDVDELQRLPSGKTWIVRRVPG